jgi:hypothetical protein
LTKFCSHHHLGCGLVVKIVGVVFGELMVVYLGQGHRDLAEGGYDDLLVARG